MSSRPSLIPPNLLPCGLSRSESRILTGTFSTHRLTRFRAGLASLTFLAFQLPGPASAGTEIPITFQISPSPAAVALQFDVASAVPSSSLSEPTLTGFNTHRIESQVLSGGARRFLIYSTAGEPIAADGNVQVSIDLQSTQPQNGILTVSGIMASDASGNSVPASPGALPVITGINPAGGETVAIGRSIPVSIEAVDLDGNVSGVVFLVDSSLFAADSTPPFATSVVSSLPATHIRTVVARVEDNEGKHIDSPPISLRFQNPASLTTYEAFQNIWFGSSQLESAAFNADPFATGIPNHLAWALGMDPRMPDWARFPVLDTVNSGTGRNIILRARVIASGVVYQVLTASQIGPVNDWEPMPSAQITETLEADGWRLIEASVPESSANRRFFKLHIQQP